MKRNDILSSKGYWEEAERTPEEIADKVKEAVNNALQEAQKIIGSRKITNSTEGWSEGCNYGLEESQNIIESLQIKDQ